MWRFTPCPVKLGPFDGRLFIILMAALLLMPVIGHYAAASGTIGSLVVFWVVEKFGLDVNQVFRWLRCWVAGNYHTAAGARFDQPRARLTTLPMLGLVVVMGHHADNAMADFRVTDIKTAVKPVATSPLKAGEYGTFVTAPCKPSAGITESGKSRSNVRVTTRGHGIPLRTALKAIAPKGWHASKTYDVDGDLPLSWDKGEEFTIVLATLAHAHNLSIHVDWAKKKIHVKTACVQAPAGTMAAGALGDGQNGASFETAKAVATPPVVAPVVAKPIVANYMLRTGQQLSVALREWCEMANKAEKSGLPWSLRWEAARDQEIEANSFYGDHIENAIDKLQATIIGNNLPFRVAKWPNHVIKVTN